MDSTTEDLVNEGGQDDGLPVYGDLEDIEPYEGATPVPVGDDVPEGAEPEGDA